MYGDGCTPHRTADNGQSLGCLGQRGRGKRGPWLRMTHQHRPISCDMGDSELRCDPQGPQTDPQTRHKPNTALKQSLFKKQPPPPLAAPPPDTPSLYTVPGGHTPAQDLCTRSPAPAQPLGLHHRAHCAASPASTRPRDTEASARSTTAPWCQGPRPPEQSREDRRRLGQSERKTEPQLSTRQGHEP